MPRFFPPKTVLRRASTGPRSFERGDAAVELKINMDTYASTGPRSFERGDNAAKFLPSSVDSLQRGRALSSAEILGHLAARAADVVASTGPRSFERGDMVMVSGYPCDLYEASTGPRSFERGDRRRRLPCALVRGRASTGPRSFERGDSPLLTVCCADAQWFDRDNVFVDHQDILPLFRCPALLHFCFNRLYHASADRVLSSTSPLAG